MVTRNVKEFKNMARAQCSAAGEKEGVLYFCKVKDSWFLLHNNTMTGDGGKPDGFESLKEQHGFKRSWHLAYAADSTSSYNVELLDHVETEFLSGEDIKKCIRMHSSYDGMRIRATRNRSKTAKGIAHYCKDSNKWFFLSDNDDFSGDTPEHWSNVKKEYNITFSWFFANGRDGNIEFDHMDSIEVLGAVPAKKKEEPKPEVKCITIDYSSLEAGAKVLFATVGELPEMVLPTVGILHEHNSEWYILHNESTKDGSRPPGISSLFDGEYHYSWSISNSKYPYQNLTRLEILSRPEKKVVIGHKHVEDKFAVGKIITCLTKEQFKAKTRSIEFKHSGGEDNLYGSKATVTKSSEDKTMIGVQWFNGRIYTMDKSEFQEFYDDLGTTVHVRGVTAQVHKFDTFEVPYGVSGVSSSVIIDIKGTGKSIDPLSKHEYIPPANPDGKCKLTPTKDHEIAGDQVPRTTRIDTLLILGL